MKNIKALTLTVVSKMTSNYSESLGNIASVQKVFQNGKIYSIRSKESIKNAIMVQSGMYEDLEVQVDGVTQKKVSQELNATNNRALEGGYMNASKQGTYIRNSSFYFTDAISCNEFVSETRFHNNLYLATKFALDNNLNLQDNAKATGLMPYQYEYDKSLKVYSLTIDLEMIGKDKNFTTEEASNEEKADRVNSILTAVENLSLVVKGNLDNAEPLFVVGGLSNRKTHYFENVVQVTGNKLDLSDELLDRINDNYKVGLLRGQTFNNENEIIEKLNPVTVAKFFDDLREDVIKYYNNEL